jgi:hypothetical protein
MSEKRDHEKAKRHQNPENVATHSASEIKADSHTTPEDVKETTDNLKNSFWENILRNKTLALVGGLLILGNGFTEKVILPVFQNKDNYYREKVKEFDTDLTQYEVLETTQSILVHSLHTDTIPTKDFDYILPIELNYFINTLNLIGTTATTISVGESMTGIDFIIADKNTDNYGVFTDTMF